MAEPDFADDRLDQSEPLDFINTDISADSPPPTPSPAVRPASTVFSVFLFLKASQYVVYLFGWIFIPWTVLQWVFAIIAPAADFWFTKNIAGRLILGMRWSSKVNDDGNSQWVFEYVEGGLKERAGQRRTFWLLLWASACAWALFSFFSLVRLSFGWLFVAAIGLSLACSNALGFWHCDKTISRDMQQTASDFLSRNLLPFFRAQAANILMGDGNGQVGVRINEI
jgi:hypothetical protein